jgi:fructoselysine-6-phosphate deglycase
VPGFSSLLAAGATGNAKGYTRMLELDRDRYLAIQSGAVAQAARIHEVIGGWLDAGAANLFFAGTGGAAILMHPAAQLLQRRSTFPVHPVITAELIAGGHAQLGPRSIVVVPSVSGTTRESVELLRLCKARGARVLSLVGHADTPLGREADVACVNFAADDTSCENLYIQSLLIALSLLHHRGEAFGYAGLLAELQRLPGLLLSVKDQYLAAIDAHAAAIAAAPWHLITASGNCWPEAWYFSMCILEEMQLIRTRPVHAADFFHGPLELVEKGVSVAVFKGEDESRPLAERVERFAAQYTDRLLVLDAAVFALPGLSPEARALVSPAVLAAALERLSECLAERRQHPLGTRRYYNRVAY